MNRPLSISVIIPTYNEPDLLEAALQSLALQNYPSAAVEIVVVDDASQTSYPERYKASCGPFALQSIRHSTNEGRARARNSGIRASSGELIVFLDSDMTVEPNFLAAHAAAHRGEKTVVIGNIQFGPQIPVSSLTRYIDSRGVHRLNANETVPFKCFVTGNSSVLREQVLRLGLFDEDFTAYGGEDLELGYRLFLDRSTFLYAPAALSHHNHLRPFPQICQLMHTYGRQSLPLLLRKHPDLAPLLRLGFLQEPLFSPKRLFMHFALLPLIYYPIYWAVRASLKVFAPDLFIDYLWWYNRTRGYLAATT